MNTSFDLSTGKSKTGRDWFMLTIYIEKYKSEAIFITQLEYDYLNKLKNQKPEGDDFDFRNN